MEPIEREEYLIQHYDQSIELTEEYKEDSLSLFPACFWDECISRYRRYQNEARVRLAALRQLNRDSYEVSLAMNKILGISNEPDN
jgi:hypothetical protein